MLFLKFDWDRFVFLPQNFELSLCDSDCSELETDGIKALEKGRFTPNMYRTAVNNSEEKIGF